MTDHKGLATPRPLDDAALDEATAHYAQRRDEGERADASAFVFRLGTEWLALATSALSSVSDMRRVHSLPHRRAGTVAGLVNIEGELIVHVSLASLLGLEQATTNETAGRTGRRLVPRLVVIADANGRLAITVDEVLGVYHYGASQVRAIPSTLSRSSGAFTTAMLDIGDRSVGFLDASRVLSALAVAAS